MVMFISKSMKVFVILYQERSLKAAAEKLCLTVPPVSRMLKIAEDNIGEKLFTIERNRITPTVAGENLYHRLQPIYNELTSITRRATDKLFYFSSPQMNTIIVADLLQDCLAHFPVPYSTRETNYMKNDDDIFISLQPVTAPSYFESEDYELMLPLSFTSSLVPQWHNSMLLTEKSLTHHASFKSSILKLREQGFTGTTRQIDNSVLLRNAYLKGEGLCFKLPNTAGYDEKTLPFTLCLKIYFYINKSKWSDNKEEIISFIRNNLPVYCGNQSKYVW